MIKKRTIATVAELRIREAGEGTAGSRTIEGYALKFGVRSKLLCDWWDYYYEVLEPGCLTKETLDRQDIKLTMYHNRQMILARSKNGVGTLNYEVDAVGVKFWADMPNTADGDTALELVKRGDIDGCSFIYSTDEEDSENCVSYEKLEEEVDGEEVLVRHVKRIDNVYDFTITPDPAYEQTSVTKREFEEASGIKLRECKKKNEDDDDDDDDDDKDEGGKGKLAPDGTSTGADGGDGEADGDDGSNKSDECKTDKKRSIIRELRKEASREF